MYDEKYFTRRMVKPLIEFFKKTNISAEELTIFRLVVGLFTAFVLLQGVYFFSLITVIIYQIVLLLDLVDGSIARHRKTFKLSWVYIDLMIHIILSFLFLLAITLSYYSKTNSLLFLILGFIASISFLFNNIFNKESSLDKYKQGHKDPKEHKENKFSNLRVFIKIDRSLGLFFILVMLNLHNFLIIFYSMLYLFSAIYKFYSEFKSLKNEK